MVFLNSTMIMFIKLVAEEKFEDTKGLTRSYKLKDRQYNGQKTEGQTIQWPKDRRTDNTMAKRQKDRQYNGQKTEGQTIQ